MLLVQPAGTHHQAVSRKQQRRICQGLQTPLSPIGLETCSIQCLNLVAVLTMKSKLAVIPGKLGNVVMEVLLDSGSSVSLVQQQAL